MLPPHIVSCQKTYIDRNPQILQCFGGKSNITNCFDNDSKFKKTTLTLWSRWMVYLKLEFLGFLQVTSTIGRFEGLVGNLSFDVVFHSLVFDHMWMMLDDHGLSKKRRQQVCN